MKIKKNNLPPLPRSTSLRSNSSNNSAISSPTNNKVIKSERSFTTISSTPSIDSTANDSQSSYSSKKKNKKDKKPNSYSSFDMEKLQIYEPNLSTRSAETSISLSNYTQYYKFQKEEIKEAQLVINEEIENYRLCNDKCTDFNILFPGQDKFNMVRLDVWNHDSICTPTLILQPKNKEDVSCCIKGYLSGMKKCQYQNRTYEGKKIKIPRLCIKGGGNSINAMKEGAVVLDLSNMRNVHVQMNHLCVCVEGGARVQDLDYTLGKHGLMSVSGTCPTLGVVGCLLAGGIGYASRKYGLSCDNLLSAEVVLANGCIVNCTSKQNSDIFYAIKGGGGGFGVVVSVTLRCYPCKNAALLTFGLYAPIPSVRKKVLRRWSNWVCSDRNNNPLLDKRSGDDSTIPECYRKELPDEVFSQLFLPTNSSIISFLSSSIDTAKLSQIDTNTDFDSKKTTTKQMLNNCSYIPGYELFNRKKKNKHKFGAWVQMNVCLRFVRYCELQSVAQGYYSPGNIFLAYKYAEFLSEEVIDVLVEATSGSKRSPKNESRVIITSAGGTINEKSKTSSPIQRPIQYLLVIEGRWNDSPNNFTKKKEAVIKWVHLLANQLSHCKGIHSTAHPEATREVVSKSGRSDPPIGWYNFEKESGKRLDEIRRKRDGKGVFSLACSRISWREESEMHNDAVTVDVSDESVDAQVLDENKAVPSKSDNRMDDTNELSMNEEGMTLSSNDVVVLKKQSSKRECTDMLEGESILHASQSRSIDDCKSI